MPNLRDCEGKALTKKVEKVKMTIFEKISVGILAIQAIINALHLIHNFISNRNKKG